MWGGAQGHGGLSELWGKAMCGGGVKGVWGRVETMGCGGVGRVEGSWGSVLGGPGGVLGVF